MKIAVIGAGGHSRSLINLLEHLRYDIEGIYDDAYSSAKPEYISGYLLKNIPELIPSDLSVVLAMGSNSLRKQLWEKWKHQILSDNMIYPNSIVEKRVELGKSNQIFANALLNNEVKVGHNNILNTGCIIEHETQIGSHNHIAVGAVLCGRVKIADNCLIGANAVINPTISITNNVVIGAGAVVVKNITESGTYVGNPARKIK